MAELTVQLDFEQMQRLERVCQTTGVGASVVVADALAFYEAGLDRRGDAPHRWTREDLAAIQEGFDQLDRGEGVSQDVVEREIAELLRS